MHKTKAISPDPARAETGTCACSTSGGSKTCKKPIVKAMLELRGGKFGVPVGPGRDLMVVIQRELREGGFAVSMVRLCRWFGVARRSVHYRPTKAPPTVKPELGEPIKALIEDSRRSAAA